MDEGEGSALVDAPVWGPRLPGGDTNMQACMHTCAHAYMQTYLEERVRGLLLQRLVEVGGIEVGVHVVPVHAGGRRRLLALVVLHPALPAATAVAAARGGGARGGGAFVLVAVAMVLPSGAAVALAALAAQGGVQGGGGGVAGVLVQVLEDVVLIAPLQLIPWVGCMLLLACTALVLVLALVLALVLRLLVGGYTRQMLGRGEEQPLRGRSGNLLLRLLRLRVEALVLQV